MGRQLLLGVHVDDPATFDNYLAGPNAEVVEVLQAMAGGGDGPAVLWLAGPAGTGKSHLLRAACRHAAGRGRAARYLGEEPGKGEAGIAALLARTRSSELVCFDDAARMAGDPALERALLNVLLEAASRQARVALAASAPPAGCGFDMPALASRLASGPIYRLVALGDAEKLQALQLRAGCRGMELPAAVARYVMRHGPRDMPSLFALLDRLDAESLAENRRLTVPFLRKHLGT